MFQTIILPMIVLKIFFRCVVVNRMPYANVGVYNVFQMSYLVKKRSQFGLVRAWRSFQHQPLSMNYVARKITIIYTAHKKFMNTSTSAESVASFILEGGYLENQTS